MKNAPLLLLPFLAASLVLASCAGESTADLQLQNPPQGVQSPAFARVLQIAPIKGVVYKPSPHDYDGSGHGLYEDSDFCNEDFKELWGPTGRDDLAKLAAAGVQFLHLYDWNQPGSGRDHRGFLNRCNQLGLKVAVPWSRWYVLEVQKKNPNTREWARNMVKEVYNNKKPHPAVIMWTVGNEWDHGDGQTAQGVVDSVKLLIEAEDNALIPEAQRIAITAPVAFVPRMGSTVEGAGAVQTLQRAFEANGLGNVWKRRFIASINSFNPGSYLKVWATSRFPQEVPNTLFMMYEMGKEIGDDVQTEEQQGEAYAERLQAMKTVEGNYIGHCVFSYINEAWKKGTEAQFGIYKLGGVMRMGHTTKGQPYPIDVYIEKPAFAAMRAAYTGN